MIADFKSIIGHPLNLSPRHVPILALPEQVGVRNIKSAVEPVLLQKRRRNRRMTGTTIVEGKHHELFRNRFFHDSRGIIHRNGFRVHHRHPGHQQAPEHFFLNLPVHHFDQSLRI